jgi:heme/copper-type cytochrome/quinol oxidase subunit 2
MDLFHNFNCSLLLGVFIFTIILFISIVLNNKIFKNKNVDYRIIELICRILPCIILLSLIVPSLTLLYYRIIFNQNRSISVKVTGHQWYWRYNYRDLIVEFDSYIKQRENLLISESRLLEVDNRLVLPINTNIQFCITSGDVIHSWALPRMSIKIDAIRGILRILYYKFQMVGVYHGQCSEICGANHRFIPITLEVTTPLSFINWLSLLYI